MLVCIIPAAGESKRFPWNKLLYVYNERPIIVQTIENVLKSNAIDEVIVVIGFQADRITKTIYDHGLREVRIVYNPDYTRGMSSSIKIGVDYIRRMNIEPNGIVITPGDTAWIHPGIYALVASKFYDYLGRYNVFVASYRGRRGHPVVFSKELHDELYQISEERMGLKELLKKYQNSTMLIETEYPGVLLDLDTLIDLLRVKQYVFS